MRLIPLLLLSLVLSGCRAHQTYFRGVDRSIYEPEIEEISPELSATLSADLVADTQARDRTDWLTPVALTTEGMQGRAEWSPDGSYIVLQSVRVDGPAPNPWEQTYLMDADGSNQRRITPGIGKSHGAVIVPGVDGFVVAYGSTHHLGVTPTRDVPAVGDSADHEMDLIRQDLDKGTFETLADGAGFDGEPHFCDDGSKLAFTSARTGDLEVYVLSATVNPAPITSRPGADESPRLSPDCAQVLWIRRMANGSELVLAKADGTDTRTLVSAQASLHTPSFSPDGSHVLFAADLPSPGGQLDLFAVNSSGDGLRRITFTEGSERTPRISPDGSSLLFSADGGGSPQLFVAPYTATAGTPWTPERRDRSTP